MDDPRSSPLCHHTDVTIADLVAALQRFRWLSLGVFLAVLIAGIAGALLPAERFESQAVVSLEPVGKDVGFESQQAIKLVIPPTIARIESSTFMRALRDALPGPYSDDPLSVSAVNDPGTTIIDLGVRGSTPAGAEAAARAAVQVVLDEPRSDRFAVTVLSPPDRALSVKSQRAPAIIGGAIVLGLILATLLAAFAHRVRPPLPRAAGFWTRYNHQVLGEIPRARDDRELDGNDSGELAEAFRSLETRVRQGIVARSADPTACTIAITSWGAREGKSTVVGNLARTIAAHGGAVTAVDCDLRHPTLHTLLGVQLSPGLADAPPVRRLLQPTQAPALDVIAAGEARRHPSEIVSESVGMALLLLRTRTVLLDTPPMFTAETTTVVGAADFVLLVADYPTRKPEELDEALAELGQSGTPVLGVVFNRTDTPDGRGRDGYVYRPPVTAPPPSA